MGVRLDAGSSWFGRRADSSLRLLLVDGDASCALPLSARGHLVEVATSIAAARAHVSQGRSFDAWLVGLSVHRRHDGLDLVERARRLSPSPPVLVLSASSSLDDAFTVGRSGAGGLLTKPFDIDELETKLASCIALKNSRPTNRFEARSRPVVVSEAMRRVMEQAERVAATPRSSALILGESGVGKEIVASHIHESSHRRASPFVRVNLAALPDTMIDAELFGSVRGAFTDARQDRTGLVASAQGGTLLLDELCEMRIDLQPKLLRVLENRRFFPVGSDKERHADVRIIAATNAEPHEAISAHRLRADLYYRLSAAVLYIPPLRERREDVDALLTYFLDELAAEAGSAPPRLPRAVRRELLDYGWPGNVRELRNVAARITMLAQGDDVTSAMLGLRPSSDSARVKVRGVRPGTQLAPAGSQLGLAELQLGAVRDEVVATFERARIEDALSACGGSRSEAAKLLGVSRSTLWGRMKRYGIEPDER